MKSIIVTCLFLGLCLCVSTAMAGSHAVIPTNNGNKVQSDASGKEGSGKYTFALFNFFTAQTKSTDDSTTVKKEEPATLPKIKSNPVL